MLIFVYGTLKRGHRLHGHLAGSSFIGDGVTQPLYRLFRIGWFPGLVEHDAGLCVHGELWDATKATLDVLDEVEGVSEGLFERRPVQLAAPFDRADIESYFFSGDVTDAEDGGDCW